MIENNKDKITTRWHYLKNLGTKNCKQCIKTFGLRNTIGPKMKAGMAVVVRFGSNFKKSFRRGIWLILGK